MKLAGTRQLYVMKNPDINIIKIGMSDNIEERKKALEMACGCSLLVLFTTPHLMNADTYEKRVHDMFKDKRRIGEWFNITEDEAIAAIKKVTEHATMDAMVEEYAKGVSITKLAKDYGVTRQAILMRLKKYGVYNDNGDIYEVSPQSTVFKNHSKKIEKENLPPIVKYNINDNSIPDHDVILDEEQPSPKDIKGFKRFEPNINYNGIWYQIAIYKDNNFVFSYTKDVQKARDYVNSLKT